MISGNGFIHWRWFQACSRMKGIFIIIWGPFLSRLLTHFIKTFRNEFYRNFADLKFRLVSPAIVQFWILSSCPPKSIRLLNFYAFSGKIFYCAIKFEVKIEKNSIFDQLTNRDPRWASDSREEMLLQRQKTHKFDFWSFEN